MSSFHMQKMGQVLAKIGQFIIHTICNFSRNSVLNGKKSSQATLPAEEVKEPLITTQDSNVILIIAEDEVQDQSSGTDKIIFEYSCSNSSNNDEIVKDKEVAITVSPNEILAYNGCDNCISNVDGNTVNCAEGETQSINVVVKPKKIQGKWFMHYCSSHKILLVGEGDFSFSVCLAKAFGSASNMVATSLDSLEFLMENYPSAVSNIGYLRKRGCSVVHEVDVTDDLDLHPLVYMHAHEYDRIIFNFPLAGFFQESRKQALKRNRRLVRLFFEQARYLIVYDGEIHITHKTSAFYREWNIENLAKQSGLRLIEDVEFKLSHYRGYNNKYGFGGNENFNCYPSKTYKFRLK